MHGGLLFTVVVPSLAWSLVGLSAILTAAAAIFAAWGKDPSVPESPAEPGARTTLGFGGTDVLRQLRLRLSEARRLERRQRLIQQRYEWASNALLFGQYILGGVLASSFVQQWLSATVIGVLGLIVLVASLIQQGYRPQFRLRAASLRVVQVAALIRIAEDRLAMLQNGDPGALGDILTQLSNGLLAVEMSETTDTLTGDETQLKRLKKK